MDLCHTAVSFRTKPQLDLYESFKARVKKRNTEVDELRKFRAELVIEGFVCYFGKLGLAFCPWKLRGVFVRFLDKFLNLGAGSVVIKEFMVAFLDA